MAVAGSCWPQFGPSGHWAALQSGAAGGKVPGSSAPVWEVLTPHLTNILSTESICSGTPSMLLGVVTGVCHVM